VSEYLLAFILFQSTGSATGVAVYPVAVPHKTLDSCYVEAAKMNKTDPDVTSKEGRAQKAEWVCLKVNRVTV